MVTWLQLCFLPELAWREAVFPEAAAATISRRSLLVIMMAGLASGGLGNCPQAHVDEAAARKPAPMVSRVITPAICL